jgi:hypothetical protein
MSNAQKVISVVANGVGASLPIALLIALLEKKRQWNADGRRRWKASDPDRFKKLRNAYLKSHRARNPEKCRALDKANYNKRRDQKLSHKRANQPKNRIVKANWRNRNRALLRKQWRESYSERKKSPQFRIKLYLRNRMSRLIKERSTQIFALIGCTSAELKVHLESLFEKGMCWDNYGRNGWHIDHIVPCSKFDLTRPDHIRQCFHWTNLKPLWCIDNLKKYNHIRAEFGNLQPSLGI